MAMIDQEEESMSHSISADISTENDKDISCHTTSKVQKKELADMKHTLEEVDDFVKESTLNFQQFERAVHNIHIPESIHPEHQGYAENIPKKIVLKKEDIQLLMEQGLMNRSQAEECLKYHQGDLKAALVSIIYPDTSKL